MTIPGYLDAKMQAEAGVKGWKTRAGPTQARYQTYKDHYIRIYMPSKHYADAVKAEAKVRNMSINSFMRAMIRGYFAAALHGR